MGFESTPKPEKFSGERIKIVGKDGVERSLTLEELEEHRKKEEREARLKEHERQKEGLGSLIQKLKGTLNPEKPEEDDDSRGEEKAA